MPAIAVSKNEEQQIARLQKALGIPTKAGVIRAAICALERETTAEKLRLEIRESVRKCAVADRAENRSIYGAGVTIRGQEA